MGKVMVAAHQGVYQTGYILGNTLEAFDIALKDGADIIELDAALSAEGTVFTYHPDTEKTRLGLPNGSLRTMKDAEIKALRQRFPDGQPSYFPVYTLEESLTHLKGRCLINIDKSWTCPEEIMQVVRKVGVEEQVIFKSNISGDGWEKELHDVERFAPEIKYMPVLYHADAATAVIERKNINFYGAELCFSTEDCELCSEQFIDKMHEKGRKLWINSIIFNYKTVLCAGHSDNASLINPDDGWGWIARKGYDIIQTDWTRHCRQYLDTAGY